MCVCVCDSNCQFRKTAFNFHYEFNIRHMAGVFQGMLMAKPEQVNDALKLAQLWLHESERTYCDRLVNFMDQKKYKELAAEQAKKCAPRERSKRARRVLARATLR